MLADAKNAFADAGVVVGVANRWRGLSADAGRPVSLTKKQTKGMFFMVGGLCEKYRMQCTIIYQRHADKRQRDELAVRVTILLMVLTKVASRRGL